MKGPEYRTEESSQSQRGLGEFISMSSLGQKTWAFIRTLTWHLCKFFEHCNETQV